MQKYFILISFLISFLILTFLSNILHILLIVFNFDQKFMCSFGSMKRTHLKEFNSGFWLMIQAIYTFSGCLNGFILSVFLITFFDLKLICWSAWLNFSLHQKVHNTAKDFENLRVFLHFVKFNVFHWTSCVDFFFFCVSHYLKNLMNCIFPFFSSVGLPFCCVY